MKMSNLFIMSIVVLVVVVMTNIIIKATMTMIVFNITKQIVMSLFLFNAKIVEIQSLKMMLAPSYEDSKNEVKEVVLLEHTPRCRD